MLIKRIFVASCFLVTCTRLCQPLCRSVGRSVGQSAGPSKTNYSEHATYGDWPCYLFLAVDEVPEPRSPPEAYRVGSPTLRRLGIEGP